MLDARSTAAPEVHPPIEISTAADWDAINALLHTVFHSVPDEAMNEASRALFEPERSLLVRSGAEVVAHAGAFTRELSVPGGVVPAAHVTNVGVAPTHRRQGLLTRLMHRQLRDIRSVGREPVAVLWASEGPIYPRFGYGLAAQRLTLEIYTRELRMVESASVAGSPPPRLRLADPIAVQAELAAVYDRVRAARPGWSSRTDAWWRYVLGDFPSRRSGGTERRAVLADGPDGPTGYAVWRTHNRWQTRGPQSTVQVDEFVATDLATYHALWRFLLSVDLTRVVTYRFAAVDEPLHHLVDEPRQLGGALVDALWLRIVDVGKALSARAYAAPVDVVLEVTDPLLPENAGRWRLTAAPGTARCIRTDAPAELACDVRDLGAAYLGGPSFGALAAAGRVRELRPGVLPQVSAAFGWHRAPVGIEIF